MSEYGEDGNGASGASDVGNAAHGVWGGLVRLLRENHRVVVVAVCVIAFVLLLEEVLEGEATRIDTMAYSFFVTYLRNDTLTPFMEQFSSLASPVELLVMLLLVAVFAPGKRPGLCAATNLVLVIVLNTVLKTLVQRSRPDGFRLVAETGFSFPSGHSMVAMAFFGLLAWMAWHYEDDRRHRMLWCVLFSLVIVMIGVSRIYLGVHYATDVIAGFCVSLAWLAIYTKVAAPLFFPQDSSPSTNELPPNKV